MTRAKKKSALPFTADPLWYKDAVVYQLHVKSFFDGNNDGVGDFAGLIEKLGYIAELGVNTIWLLPFYPSPRRDDGYDIAEYRGVHPDYGDMADVRRFIREAHKRGLRVVTELVVNHTSDQHPWFQRARRAKAGSKAREFYVWSDTDTKYAGTRVIFCDTEKSNWTWDPVANAYYWHRFYSHQPDLNYDNPQVLKAVLSVMRWWLDLGVDGLRLDAVPYLVEREGTSSENLPESHAVLKRIRAVIDQHYPDRMLLAEANQWPEDVQEYFGGKDGGKGDECHMAFHFPLMPRMYMALAQEDRFPVTDILRQTPDIPANCQWAVFLRNHDELTLEMVTDKERDYLWEQYASDKRARLNLGIRRRLAPLLQRDRRRIELLNSILLSMPGTPVIYYGDELGMGDNIHLGDRDGVRTPMQWSLDRNGGFSRADPAALVLPPIMDSLYGYQAINVEAQARDPHSLLNWMRRMLGICKQVNVFGRGRIKLLYPTNRRILAYLREHTPQGGATQTVLCVANVSRSAQAVELDLSPFIGSVPVEMVGGAAFPPIGQLPYLLTLPPYGFYWFLIAAEAQMPSWHSAPPEPLPDYVTLVLRHDVNDILAEPSRSILEREVLPLYLQRRRWFAEKDAKLQQARIVHATALPGAERPILLAEVETVTERGRSCYLLPFGFLPEEEANSPLPQQLALARVRRGRKVGFLTDGFALDALAHGVIALLRKKQTLTTDDGQLHFTPTSQLDQLELAPNAEVRRLAAEQSNSSIVVGERVIIKLIRHVAPGQQPEAEMGRVLTERGFANVAPMLGEVTRIAPDGTPHVLMVVQGYMDNQGDAWSWTQNMLERAIQDAVTPLQGAAPAARADARDEFARFAGVLGKRLGEMHAVLAQPCDDPAFAPARATAQDAQRWLAAVQTRIDEAFTALTALRENTSDAVRKLAQQLLHQRERLHKAAAKLAARGEGALLTRTHGDFHLGQVLVVKDDAYIIDFEGEPARPLDERRAKTSPLRDFAGMLRSFDYASAMAEAAGGAGQTAHAQERKAEVIARFRRISEQTFGDAYRAAAQKNAGDSQTSQALIDLFTLEKAAYEIVYEASHRPEWIGVPMRGLAALAHRLTI